jgi:hypothetical protein
MGRTQEPEIRQPVHHEGCPETPQRQKAGLAETRTGYSFEMIRAWIGSLHDINTRHKSSVALILIDVINDFDFP